MWFEEVRRTVLFLDHAIKIAATELYFFDPVFDVRSVTRL